MYRGIKLKTPRVVALRAFFTNLKDWRTFIVKNLHDFREKRNNPVKARPWKIMVQLRRKSNRGSYQYRVSGTNGRTHVGLFGSSILGFQPTASLQAEFRGLAQSFDWVKHQAPTAKTRIAISLFAYAIFAGEQTCPLTLVPIRSRLLRTYAGLPNVVVESYPFLPPAQAAQERIAA
jgi:hypothetical protein